MALKISRVVNVQLNTVPKSAARKGFGVVALFTPESGQAFMDAKTRYIYVDSQQEVEQLFGTNSETAKCAMPFFAQRPRAKQLIITRWQKQGANIEATANTLSGATLSDDLDQFKAVRNGCFALTIGATVHQITGLDFNRAADFNAIASKINEKFSALNVAFRFDEVGNRFILQATTSGENADTIIHPAFKDESEGEYIGAMLKLENGQASQKRGSNAVTLKAESLAQALGNVAEVENSWYGFTVAAQLTDSEIEAAAKYAQANTKLFGANAIRPEQLEWQNNNVFKHLADAQLDHTLVMFDKNDLYPASSALARLLSMNFAANNSTITLKFKTQPTVTADDITATEYTKAKRLGINVYTYFDDVPMIAEQLC